MCSDLAEAEAAALETTINVIAVCDADVFLFL